MNKTSQEGMSWNCGACTFENGGNRNVCEMCGSSKPEPPPPESVLRCLWKCDNDVVIEVRKGDLTAETSDAIVSSSLV